MAVCYDRWRKTNKKLDFWEFWLILIIDKVDEFALLQENLGNGVLRAITLAPFTSFRIGGQAKYLFKAKTPGQLTAAYNVANTNNIRYFILGGGSNIVIDDEGFAGLIVKDECRQVSLDGSYLSAQSGVPYDHLVDVATANGLSGLEFAAGIPGTVAGALWGNAGAWGKSIADILESAVLVAKDGQIRITEREFFQFDYRHSRLKSDPYLILTVKLKLAYGEKNAIADKVNEYRQLRRTKHPTWEGSAGSVFKNIKEPVLIPAGKLLEEAGLKGAKIGGAEIYEKHCNIIVNKGQATASDVRKLAQLMQEKVQSKFDRRLDYEISFVGP